MSCPRSTWLAVQSEPLAVVGGIGGALLGWWWERRLVITGQYTVPPPWIIVGTFAGTFLGAAISRRMCSK